MKILVTEPEYFTADSLKRMRSFGTVVAKRMSRAELLREVKDVSILIVRIETRVDKTLIEKAEKLACVISATTGLNHIDVALLKEKGIPLYSLKGTHSVSTAEHALALMFAVSRNIVDAHNNLLRGNWTRWKFIGTEINGKTLGIFGLGRIGREVAKRARVLGMNVISYDPFVSTSIMKQHGVKKVTFNNLITQSDLITIHAPLTQATSGIFGAKEFKAMKPSLIIINTARGGIIQEKSLINALKDGSIRCAAIDVFSEEPLPPSSPLRRYAKSHGNLILTPHLGASTREAMTNASMFAVVSVREFLGKKKLNK